jgi:hypothetical protein
MAACGQGQFAVILHFDLSLANSSAPGYSKDLAALRLNFANISWQRNLKKTLSDKFPPERIQEVKLNTYWDDLRKATLTTSLFLILT